MKIGGILILALFCQLALGPSNAVQERIDRKLKEDEMDESKHKQVLANTATILCLEFSWEFCGAFCEGHVAYYTFDAKTGDVVNLKKLFTESGY